MILFSKIYAILTLWIALFFLFVFSSALNAQPPELNQALEKFIQAWQEGNSEAILDWIHPEFIDQSGGKARMLGKGGGLEALKLIEVQEVMEIITMEGRIYAPVRIKATMKLDFKKMRGNGMGMALGGMLMELKDEFGDENVRFDEASYEVSINNQDVSFAAVEDPRYHGWKFMPLNSEITKKILPPEVLSHFDEVINGKMVADIKAAANAFIKVVMEEGPEAESAWFGGDKVPEDLEGTKGLDRYFSFQQLDTIYHIDTYNKGHFIVLGFSGNRAPKDEVEPNPLFFFDDQAILVAVRKESESSWQFVWEKQWFTYLPSRVNPYKIIAGIEAQREDKRRFKELKEFNKTVEVVSKNVKQQSLEGSWSGADGSGLALANMIFQADSTYSYNYIQRNGYTNDRSGNFEYLGDSGMYRLHNRSQYQYQLRFLEKDVIIVSPRYKENPGDLVFQDGTDYLLFRNGSATAQEYDEAVREELLEKQRHVLFGLKQQAGMRVFWSHNNLLKRHSCNDASLDKLVYVVSVAITEWYEVNMQMDLWAGGLPEWDENACVISYELARMLAGKEKAMEKLIGQKFPCEPGHTIVGIIKPNDRYKQSEIPKDLPILFLSE